MSDSQKKRGPDPERLAITEEPETALHRLLGRTEMPDSYRLLHQPPNWHDDPEPISDHGDRESAKRAAEAFWKNGTERKPEKGEMVLVVDLRRRVSPPVDTYVGHWK